MISKPPTFEITLNYEKEMHSLNPPSTLKSLLETTKKKFDLVLINKLTYMDEDEEVRLSNETDYLNLFDYVEKENLPKIDLHIISYEGKSRKKTESTFNKWAYLRPQVYERGLQSNLSNGCINEENDLRDDIDTRNLKFKLEKGKWTHQSYSVTEQRRIRYIIEKKQYQRIEQMRKEGKLVGIDEEYYNINDNNSLENFEININVNPKKRVLKNKNKKVEEVPDKENNTGKQRNNKF